MISRDMFNRLVVLFVSITFAMAAPVFAGGTFTFCCSPDNDLYRAVAPGLPGVERYDDPMAAVEKATTGSALLVLADGYPTSRTAVPGDVYEQAAERKLRLYIEFPEAVPGVVLGQPQQANWERLVVEKDAFGGALPAMSILGAHSCVYLPTVTSGSLVAIARVAGFDKAVFGVPASANSALLETEKSGWLVATTGLSHFQRGRFAPVKSWTALWTGILKHLNPDGAAPRLEWEPVVTPAFSENEALPTTASMAALEKIQDWYFDSGLLCSEKGEIAAKTILTATVGTATLSQVPSGGEGRYGILEGFVSQIAPDGSQPCLVPLRADCISESAMALALSGDVTSRSRSAAAARNLLDYTYFTSGLCGGERGNPGSPAYGLIAWGVGDESWEKANYGDDNARAVLATMAASAALKDDRWKVPMLRAILANYRTTGKLGFRGDRVDMGDLAANGWRHYFEAEPRNPAPHFEAMLWACYLWGYRATGYEPLLERARTGISETMKVYPAGWRWNDMLERAHILLPLAWLVRAEDTPQSRQWLKTITDELLAKQEACGALPETIKAGGGHYQVPQTNEAYGTAETPLIQTVGDKASDQLYTTGFALIGLHEAAAATGDPRLKAAEDELADYLIRIQTRSQQKWLNGVWFRAFDYGNWDYWASSADIGWGAWVIETGWGQAWIASTLALREKKTSFWEATADIRFEKADVAAALKEMELR